MLLLAIFQLQEEEDDEIREDSDLKTAGKYHQYLISLYYSVTTTDIKRDTNLQSLVFIPNTLLNQSCFWHYGNLGKYYFFNCIFLGDLLNCKRAVVILCTSRDHLIVKIFFKIFEKT